MTSTAVDINILGTTVTFPEFAATPLEDAWSQMREALNAFESGQPAAESQHRDELNRAVWRMLELVAWARISETLGSERLPGDAMSNAERLLLDFGYVGDPRIDPQTLRSLLEKPARGPVPVVWLHDHLSTMASQAIKVPDLDMLREQISAGEQELRAREQASGDALAAHEALLGSLPEGSRLLDIQKSINDIVPPLCFLLSGRHIRADALRQKQKLTEGWNRLRKCQEDLIATYSERKAVADSHNRYVNTVTAQKKTELQLDMLRAQTQQISQDVQDLSYDALLASVTAQFKALRKILRTANRQGPKAVPQVFLEEPPVRPVSAVLAVIADTLNVDERMAHAWHTGRWNKPRIVVPPGAGPATYDPQTRHIWAPIIAHEEGFSSMVRCLGLHRFHDDRLERDSFARLEQCDDIYSLDGLAEEFTRYYETYVMREAKGFRKLPNNMRKWFCNHTAKSP